MGSKAEEIVKSKLDDLNKLQPWDRLPGESAAEHELFLKYMLMGPQRSMKKLYRAGLINNGELYPGEPTPNVPSRWTRMRAQWDWINRTAAWDQRNFDLMVSSHEQAISEEIQDMVDEHLEGLRVFRRAAILGIYERDDQGNIVCDADGQPRIKIPDDESVAWRIFKQAIEAERTATGMPTSISIMTNRQIEERIVELRNQLGVPDGHNVDDVIDAEYTESTEGDE